MKKILIISIIYIIIGFIIGIIILQKINLSPVMNKYYFICNKNKCFGITLDYELAEAITIIYNNKNMDVIIDEVLLSNEELKSNIEQFDLLVKESKDYEEIIKIEEVVMANYEEIVRNY